MTVPDGLPDLLKLIEEPCEVGRKRRFDRELIMCSRVQKRKAPCVEHLAIHPEEQFL